MTQQKLTPEQVRRIEEIEEFQRTADHLLHLVKELESNRAGHTRTIQQLSDKIGTESSQMRQRALTANIGTIADVAGMMSVMAGRGGGINMKIRALTDCVNSLSMQLEVALRQATAPPAPEPKKQS